MWEIGEHEGVGKWGTGMGKEGNMGEVGEWGKGKWGSGDAVSGGGRGEGREVENTSKCKRESISPQSIARRRGEGEKGLGMRWGLGGGHKRGRWVGSITL